MKYGRRLGDATAHKPHEEEAAFPNPFQLERVLERREELISLLQTHYGMERSDAVREVSEFFAERFQPHAGC